MQTTLTAPAEFAFTDRDFGMISDIANTRYGLYLQPSKKALVYSRLSKRLRALKLSGFEDYCALLNRAEGDTEQAHLLSALTTNVTHFFREAHHFAALRDEIAPKLLAKAKAGGGVRIWSAACSSGQEAYSIATTLLKAAPDLRNLDAKILATDIDPKVIATARTGRYPIEQVTSVATEWRKYLPPRPSGAGDELEMDPSLKSLISFGELNLIADWPMRRKFDVIFCRNAAIYFDKQTQARLWQRFSDALVEDGYLMIGHSERLSGPAKSHFKSVGITSYRKTSNPAEPDQGDNK